MSADNSRKDELLAAARDRLTQSDDSYDESARTADAAPAEAEIMYRGQVVRRKAAPTPGSTGRGDAERNAQIRVAVQRIKDDYAAGLITRAEAERRRAEVMERL